MRHKGVMPCFKLTPASLRGWCRRRGAKCRLCASAAASRMCPSPVLIGAERRSQWGERLSSEKARATAQTHRALSLSTLGPSVQSIESRREAVDARSRENIMASLPEFLAVKTSDPAVVAAAPNAKKQPLFLTAGDLTFPGVTVVAGSILNAVAGDSGTWRAWAAAIIAVVFGAFITWLSPPRTRTARRRRLPMSLSEW